MLQWVVMAPLECCMLLVSLQAQEHNLSKQRKTDKPMVMSRHESSMGIKTLSSLQSGSNSMQAQCLTSPDRGRAAGAAQEAASR